MKSIQIIQKNGARWITWKKNRNWIIMKEKHENTAAWKIIVVKKMNQHEAKWVNNNENEWNSVDPGRLAQHYFPYGGAQNLGKNCKMQIPSQWWIHIYEEVLDKHPKSKILLKSLDLGFWNFNFRIWDLGGARRLGFVRVSAASLFINVCKAAVPCNAESDSPVAIAIVWRFACRRPPRYTTKNWALEIWRGYPPPEI